MSVLVQGKRISLYARCVVVALVFAAASAAAGPIAQLYYRGKMEAYFLDIEKIKRPLPLAIVPKKGHPILVPERLSGLYIDMMERDLGRYQAREFKGWYVDFAELVKNQPGVFLTYDIHYQQKTVVETFVLSGFGEGVSIIMRQVFF